MNVLLIGESLIDKITAPNGPTRLTSGGSMLNMAIGLRRLGRTTRLVTDFGLDASGRILADYAASNDLELQLRANDERANPTSVSHVSLDASGSASYLFDFTWDTRDKPFSGACKLDFDLLGPGSLAFGSTTCHPQPGAAKVRNWVEELRENVTVFYDPNVRPALLGDIREARVAVESFAGYADVVKSSDEDIALVYGPNASIEEVAGRWLELGVLLAVVTCGSEGAFIYSATGETIHIPARQVGVVNSSGAGDAFFTALIDRLTRISLSGTANRDRLAAISPTSLETLSAYAAAIASIPVSRPGVNPPTREELALAYDAYSFSTFAEAWQGVFRAEPRKNSLSSAGPSRPLPRAAPT